MYPYCLNDGLWWACPALPCLVSDEELNDHQVTFDGWGPLDNEAAL